MKEPLKYPSGDFTWAELAAFNGTNKPGVWQRFDEAKRNKTIIQVGERPQENGRKGKPNKLWRLVTPGQSVTTPVAATPAPVATPPAPAPVVVSTEPVVVPANEPPKLLAEPTEIKSAEPAQSVQPVEVIPVATPPATSPVAVAEPAPIVAETVPAPTETSVTVEVLRVEAPATNPTPEVVKPEPAPKDARTLTEVCPICKHPLLAIDDATGVMVWCGQPPEVCPSAENPFGHGATEKEAYYKLTEKWTRKSSVVSVGSERIQG